MAPDKASIPKDKSLINQKTEDKVENLDDETKSKGETQENSNIDGLISL